MCTCQCCIDKKCKNISGWNGHILIVSRANRGVCGPHSWKYVDSVNWKSNSSGFYSLWSHWSQSYIFFRILRINQCLSPTYIDTSQNNRGSVEGYPRDLFLKAVNLNKKTLEAFMHFGISNKYSLKIIVFFFVNIGLRCTHFSKLESEKEDLLLKWKSGFRCISI